MEEMKGKGSVDWYKITGKDEVEKIRNKVSANLEVTVSILQISNLVCFLDHIPVRLGSLRDLN